MRKPAREHGDAAADRAGIGADEVGDLPKSVAAGEGEVEHVLVGRGKFVETIENLRPRLLFALQLRTAAIAAAQIDDELHFTPGHLSHPFPGPIRPVKTSVSQSSPLVAGPPSRADRCGGRASG